eukprot:6186934-Pleurochrysis_carterae.AAC.1
MALRSRTVKNSADKLRRFDWSAVDDHVSTPASAPAGGLAGGARHVSRQSREVGRWKVKEELAGNVMQAAEVEGRSAGGCACAEGARDRAKGIVVVSNAAIMTSGCACCV